MIATKDRLGLSTLNEITKLVIRIKSTDPPSADTTHKTISSIAGNSLSTVEVATLALNQLHRHLTGCDQSAVKQKECYKALLELSQKA